MPRARFRPSEFLLAPMLGVPLLLAVLFTMPQWADADDTAQQMGHGHEMHMHGMNVIQASVQPPEEAAFLRENDAAMTKMMTDMAVKPSGNVDRDFVEMMVPHHQGAIDMAKAILRYTHNEQLRRLAQEIIVTQQQEITAMRLAIGDPLPVAQAAPTQIEPTSAE